MRAFSLVSVLFASLILLGCSPECITPDECAGAPITETRKVTGRILAGEEDAWHISPEGPARVEITAFDLGKDGTVSCPLGLSYLITLRGVGPGYDSNPGTVRVSDGSDAQEPCPYLMFPVGGDTNLEATIQEMRGLDGGEYLLFVKITPLEGVKI